MKKSKIQKFKDGKGVKKVTAIPNMFLRFKGKKDAKKPASSADAYCQKLLCCCYSYENRETIFAEEILHDYRREAALILADICNNKKKLSSKPERRNGDSPIDIRANARYAADYIAARKEVQSSVNRLCEINEIMISINATLEQRIDKTRNLCIKAINTYMLGLRTGGLADYSFKAEFSGKAIETYYYKHKIGDEAIQKCANIVCINYEEGVS